MPRGLFDKDLSNWLVRIPQWWVENGLFSFLFFSEEVITCHTASVLPAPSQRQIFFFFFFSECDMLVCFWRFLLFMLARWKRALTFAWPVCDSVCAGRHVGVDACAGVSSPYTHTHTSRARACTHGLIMTLPKWAVCSDTPLADSHSRQT